MNSNSLSLIITIILFTTANSFASDSNIKTPVLVEKPIRLADPANLTAKDSNDSFTLIQNEIVMLDNLIAMTQISLEKQKTLRELIVQYNKTQQATLADTDDNELLMRTVKMAQRVLESIQENNLTHNFDAAFLSELTLLAQIGSKYGESKP